MLFHILACTSSLWCLQMLPACVAGSIPAWSHLHPPAHISHDSTSEPTFPRPHTMYFLPDTAYFFIFCGTGREPNPTVCWIDHADVPPSHHPSGRWLAATVGHQSHTGFPVHQQFLCLKKTIYFPLLVIIICCKMTYASYEEGLTSIYPRGALPLLPK